MAYSRFMDEEVLRRVIRRKLQRGRLPYDGIRTVWSTPSDGETCDAATQFSPGTSCRWKLSCWALARGPFGCTSDVSRSGISKNDERSSRTLRVAETTSSGRVC